MIYLALDGDKTGPEGQGNSVMLMNPVMLSAAKHLDAR